MRAIDIAGFENKFRANIDAWDYSHSPFERAKRGLLLRACGPLKHGRVLELGCAIGETTRELARLSLRLVAVDASPTALKEAARRIPRRQHIRFQRAILPGQMPRGPFDVIVISELVYYLRAHHLNSLADRSFAALAPGGIAVVLNHRRPFEDASVIPALAHHRLRSRLAKRMAILRDDPYRHFDITVLQRRRLRSQTAGGPARFQFVRSGLLPSSRVTRLRRSPTSHSSSPFA
jgi:SAM-dependent methyltransferase